jgi:Ni,Fe-hydrogenase III large subunit
MRKIRKLSQIRWGYKGKWNAGAKYFFSELIRAYGLDAVAREFLMDLIELRQRHSGRPRKDALARLAVRSKEAGLSYAQIARRINMERGEGTATAESVRKLVKRHRSRQSADLRTESQD